MKSDRLERMKDKHTAKIMDLPRVVRETETELDIDMILAESQNS